MEEAGTLEVANQTSCFRSCPPRHWLVLYSCSKMSNFNHQSYTLPHMELQDRVKMISFFTLCSTSLPLFAVMLTTHIALHNTVMWYLFLLKAERRYQMWCLAHFVRMRVQTSCHKIWPNRPGEGGWHCPRCLLVPLPKRLCQSFSISAALPARCHHSKLARRLLTLKQAYCFQVFVCICLHL